MKYYTYILKSETNGSYYVGSTSNLEDRLRKHNSEENISTKKGLPWVIVYIKDFETRSEAMKHEKHIKSWKKRSMIEKLISESQ